MSDQSVKLICDSCGRSEFVGDHIASKGCPFCGKYVYGGVIDNMGQTEYRPGWKGGWMYPEPRTGGAGFNGDGTPFYG